MLMLIIVTIVATAALIMPTVFAQKNSIPLRGVVEGFYGKPWSNEQRKDMLRFLGEQGFNAYIYAPKNDPYHKARWREFYPADEMNELAQVVATANESGVEFIYALSPGADLKYEGAEWFTERRRMLAKLESLYKIGIRRYALFFDDLLGMTERSAVTMQDGKNQAKFINFIQDVFRTVHPDVKAFVTVPTEYFGEDMYNSDGVKPYTRAFAQTLSPAVLMLYTGAGVVPEGIDEKELAVMDKICGRVPGIWWNYPVNDYMESKLALGPVVNLPRRNDYPALFFNPMGREHLSKITLATGAEYAQNPATYNPEEAWHRAITKQYGELAADMEMFAAHSMRMQNSWAHTGLPDGKELRHEMDEFWLARDARDTGAESKRQKLQLKLERLIVAANRLQSELPPEILAECRPQLELFGELAQADKEALDLFQPDLERDTSYKKDLQARLTQKAKQFDEEKETARLSEQTLRAFLDEALRRASRL